MAKETIYLTAEGYKKLKEELDHMRSVERPAISAAIAEARDKGDLSENAEYDAAREAQGLLEMRIAKMEDTLANARVIDETKIDKSKVQILSKVTLKNHNTGKEVVYTIVAEQAGHRHPHRQGPAGQEEGRVRGRDGSGRYHQVRDSRHQYLIGANTRFRAGRSCGVGLFRGKDRGAPQKGAPRSVQKLTLMPAVQLRGVDGP